MPVRLELSSCAENKIDGAATGDGVVDAQRVVPCADPPAIELVLIPLGDGRAFKVLFEGEVLVASSRDPEHSAARRLLRRGIGGRAVTLDHKSGKPRLHFDIAAFAATRVVERSRGGLSIESWRPLSSDTPHVGALSEVSGADGLQVSLKPSKASATRRGNAEEPMHASRSQRLVGRSRVRRFGGRVGPLAKC